MKVLRSLYVKVLNLTLLFLASNGVFAQYVPPAPAAGPAICAWPSVPLRTYPGREAGVLVEAIYFGEQVQIVGPREYIEEERRYYVLVNTAENKQGWVHEHLFVSGGSLGVMLGSANVYKKPGAPATICEQPMNPGEIVVTAQFSGGWLMVCTAEKTKNGWIEFNNALVSQNPRDVELATLYTQAQKVRDAQAYAKKMDQVMNMARQSNSPLLNVWEPNPNERYSYNPATPTQATTRSASPTTTNQAYTPPANQPLTTASPYPSFIPKAPTPETDRIADPTAYTLPVQNQSNLVNYQETGVVADVLEARSGDLFRVYHKYLPAGTQVKLFLPNNQGTINLVVSGRLPQSSPAIIGLPTATLKTLFGDQTPPVITIQYALAGQ